MMGNCLTGERATNKNEEEGGATTAGAAGNRKTKSLEDRIRDVIQESKSSSTKS